MILINDKIKALDPYYYISKWEYYEDRTDQLAVIADALANALEETKAKLQELEDEKRCLEMRLEDCRLEAEGIIAYIHRVKNAESHADSIEAILREFDEAETAYQAALKAAKEG
jgi:chromosome segregation ATPase